jgi:hypothetical protein
VTQSPFSCSELMLCDSTNNALSTIRRPYSANTPPPVVSCDTETYPCSVWEVRMSRDLTSPCAVLKSLMKFLQKKSLRVRKLYTSHPADVRTCWMVGFGATSQLDHYAFCNAHEMGHDRQSVDVFYHILVVLCCHIGVKISRDGWLLWRNTPWRRGR